MKGKKTNIISDKIMSTIESIQPMPFTLLQDALAKIDNKTKPLGSLGVLERLAVQLALIQQDLNPTLKRKLMLVFGADHGITEEGVSAFPSEVTRQMLENFFKGGAGINVICAQHQIDFKVIDMGVKGEFYDHPVLINKKIRNGTRNFALESAMTRDEAIQAIESGMEVVFDELNSQGIDILGVGEIGIGNTTCAAAIISTVTGISPAEATGRGTGIDDNGLERKIKVIEKALAFHQIDSKDGMEILCKVGGLEIAGIVGAILAAASKKIAVVLDGVISTAAGLIAYVLCPEIKEYLIAGHKSVETAQQAALSFMGLEPVIDLKMRLGEGTGAAMAIDVADTACRVMRDMASFEEAGVSNSDS